MLHIRYGYFKSSFILVVWMSWVPSNENCEKQAQNPNWSSKNSKESNLQIREEEKGLCKKTIEESREEK